jgi:hypothetical protein
MFDAEWRDMTHDMGRHIRVIASAIKVSNERERVVQRLTKSARLHDSLAQYARRGRHP